jgi:hypothetical protein
MDKKFDIKKTEYDARLYARTHMWAWSRYRARQDEVEERSFPFLVGMGIGFGVLSYRHPANAVANLAMYLSTVSVTFSYKTHVILKTIQHDNASRQFFELSHNLRNVLKEIPSVEEVPRSILINSQNHLEALQQMHPLTDNDLKEILQVYEDAGET